MANRALRGQSLRSGFATRALCANLGCQSSKSDLDSCSTVTIVHLQVWASSCGSPMEARRVGILLRVGVPCLVHFTGYQSEYVYLYAIILVIELMAIDLRARNGNRMRFSRHMAAEFSQAQRHKSCTKK